MIKAKKIIVSLIMSLTAILCAGTFSAYAENIDSPVNIQILTPTEISGTPILDTSIDIGITNRSSTEMNNLDCFLMIVDKGRMQTYPVDEFGNEAYQTRPLSLKPGESAVVSIPVSIAYVGDFRFTASVIDYDTGTVYSADALIVNIISKSKMNKPLVMATSFSAMIITVTAVIILSRKKKSGK